MKDLSKRRLDHIEKKKICHLWRPGKTLSEIGLSVDRHNGSLFSVLKLSGGISPCLLNTSPSPRDRTRSRLPSSA